MEENQTELLLKIKVYRGEEWKKMRGEFVAGGIRRLAAPCLAALRSSLAPCWLAVGELKASGGLRAAGVPLVSVQGC